MLLTVTIEAITGWWMGHNAMAANLAPEVAAAIKALQPTTIPALPHNDIRVQLRRVTPHLRTYWPAS